MNVLEEHYKSNPSLLGSPRMIALYEYLTSVPLNERVAKPAIVHMYVTSDDIVLAETDGALGANIFAPLSEVRHNVVGLCRHFKAGKGSAKKLLEKLR